MKPFFRFPVQTALAAGIYACAAAFLALPAAAQSTTSHLGLGNPTAAVTSASATKNYLISRTQYAVGYDSTLGVPKWVCWHLSRRDLGSSGRSDNFTTDTSLPAGWTRISTNDYTGSGYDRGHNVPSADRTLTTTDNKATFIMTNIFPQAADNNQGPWADLENYCRGLVQAGNELYIVSTWDGAANNGTIASGKVKVPDYTNKIILVLSDDSQDNNTAADIARINTATRVIAISMPNEAGIRNDDWQEYRCSINDIQAWCNATYTNDATFNFLSAIPTSIRNVLKSKIDTQ